MNYSSYCLHTHFTKSSQKSSSQKSSSFKFLHKITEHKLQMPNKSHSILQNVQKIQKCFISDFQHQNSFNWGYSTYWLDKSATSYPHNNLQWSAKYFTTYISFNWSYYVFYHCCILLYDLDDIENKFSILFSMKWIEFI